MEAMPGYDDLPEEPRRSAREVLRRLTEPVMGPGERSWNLLSQLTAQQTYGLLAVVGLRDRFMERGADREVEANVLFHDALFSFKNEVGSFDQQQPAISRVRILFENYDLPVTKLAAIYETVADGSPVEWAIAHAK
jgi:hypothetical protein